MAKFTSKTVKDEGEFLRIARERFSAASKADEKDRADGQEDVQFAAGGDGQWDQNALEDRRGTEPPRPVITLNLLNEPINQVCNDGRQMNPAIKVSPGDGGDSDTAEFFQGRIRQIEYENDADTAYDTMRQCQVISGRGFIRLRTEWASNRSVRQRAVIESIDNQFSVLWDHSAKKYDKADGRFWFLISRISKDTFKSKYGQDALDRFTAFKVDGDIDMLLFQNDWVSTDELMPEVEYWTRDETEETLYEFEAGEPLFESELKDHRLEKRDGKIYQAGSDTEVPVVQTYQRPRTKVMQYIINGAEILAEHEWVDDQQIPIFPCWGFQMTVKGVKKNFSLIRHAKDPQRLVNYTVSRIAELTGQISNTKWIVAEGAIGNHGPEWQPNSQALYKQYKMYDANGRALEKPIQDTSEPNIQALTAQLLQNIDGVKKATALYSASLGDRSNEVSGKAIRARQVQGDAANFHFSDNEAKTRKAMGRALLRIIPKLDAGQQRVPIRHMDGRTELVWTNRSFEKGGKTLNYQLGQGEYNCTISTGPSYATQRQEENDRLGTLIQSAPELMFIMGDQYFATSDFHGAQECSKRMKKFIVLKNPGLIEDENGDQKQPIPPQAQAKFQALLQNQAQLMQELNALTEEVKTKKMELDSRERMAQFETQSRERIAAMQEDTKRSVALAQLDSREGIALLENKIATITQLQKMEFEAIRAQVDALHQARVQTHAELTAAESPANGNGGGGGGGGPATAAPSGEAAGEGQGAEVQPNAPVAGTAETPQVQGE